MSLRRLVKKVGKVVKAVAPVAASFIPGVGGVIAGALASKVSTKATPGPTIPPVAPPPKAPTGRALGIATQVIGGLSDLAAARRAVTPQEAVSAEPQSRILRARRVGSIRTRLVEGVAPEQLDAVTPLGEAQAAALPPRRTLVSSTRGTQPVSIASSMQRAFNIGSAIYSSLSTRAPTSTNLAPIRSSSRGLVALPGAGFATGGGFGSSSSGALSMFGQVRKRRRMNPTNVHALRRSLRRVESFVKLEKRVDKIVNRLSRARGRANRSGFVRKKR